MASLLKAIGNFFRGVRDDAAESISDPIRDGKFAIEDSKKEADSFEGQIAGLMAQRRGFERDAKEAETNATKWGNIAQKAAISGNENDAREAINKQISAEKKFVGLTSEANKCKSTEKNLRNQLETVRQKIASAESGHALHAARLEGAKVRQAISSRASGLGSALADLDALEERANAAEDKADALEELGVDGDNDLETKYDSSNVDVDDRLAALMGKTTPASAE